MQSTHTAPMVSMAFDSTSTLLATTSADSTVKVWDVVREYCTNNLNHGSAGVIRLFEAEKKTIVYHCIKT